jgi:hypothetical protein
MKTSCSTNEPEHLVQQCFISRKTIPKGWGETSMSAAAPALKILRRPQHQDALDPLSIKMLEMSHVAGQ